MARGTKRSSVGLLLTPAEWQRIYFMQGGDCAICGHPLRNRYAQEHRPEQRVASLDHDHIVEHALRKEGVEPDAAIRRSIRGLLCGYPCNRLLVRFWTQEKLAKSAAYLMQWPAYGAGVVDLMPAVRQ